MFVKAKRGGLSMVRKEMKINMDIQKAIDSACDSLNINHRQWDKKENLPAILKQIVNNFDIDSLICFLCRHIQDKQKIMDAFGSIGYNRDYIRLSMINCDCAKQTNT